ncbi:meiotic recombination protein SPO11 [Nematocida sp. ERTm5]|nr:meiotic recombination protein SPO11 [Nematocida sp. ERTm5]
MKVSRIAGIIREKSEFLLKYKECSYSSVIYDDILNITEEILTSQMNMQYAVYLLNVYYVFLNESKEMTVREVFYRCKRLFKEQKKVIKILGDIEKRLNITLNIISGYNGLLYGECKIIKEAEEIIMKNISVIPRVRPGERVVTGAGVVIVVEKEAIFNDIIQEIENIENKVGKVLIVTGKGYPCTNTLMFLGVLSSVRIYGLFDCDPHGLSIYSVYKYGSKKRPHLKIPNMQRIGVHLQDIPVTRETIYIHRKYQITLLMNLKTIEELKNDIDIMIKTKRVASIEEIVQTKPVYKYITGKIMHSA